MRQVLTLIIDRVYLLVPMFVINKGWARFGARGWVVAPRDPINKQSRITGKDYRDHLSMLACISMTGDCDK